MVAKAIDQNHASEISAILDYNERMLGAIASGDLDDIGKLTYENLVMMGDGRPASQGKERAMAAYAASVERFEVKEIWEPEDTLLDGDVAFQRGRFSIVLTPKAGGAQAETSGRYLHVYRKLAEIGWMLVMIKFASEEGGEVWNQADG